MDGFGEEIEVIPLFADLAEEISGDSVAGEQENLTGRIVLSYKDSHFDSGHFRHEDVGYHEVRAGDGELGKGAWSVVEDMYLMARSAENHSQGVSKILLVVNDENSFLHSVHFQLRSGEEFKIQSARRYAAAYSKEPVARLISMRS